MNKTSGTSWASKMSVPNGLSVEKSKAIEQDKYRAWLGQYLYHPGYDYFSDKYGDHIININNIIEDECYGGALCIYQDGSSYKLQTFIINSNKKLIEDCMNDAEKQLFYNNNKKDIEDNYDDNYDDNYEDEDDEYDNEYLADNRNKVDMPKKHTAATITDES